MPDFVLWQWLAGCFCALMTGAAKSGIPGGGTLIAPLMVTTVGNARYAAAWTAPMLSIGDVFAVTYWRRHADRNKLFSLVPWVLIGMAGGALALGLEEHMLRRIVGGIVASMLVLHIAQRRGWLGQVSRGAPFYGVAAGFASTVANAAGPIMSMYLLTRQLTKEQFVATGAWFFFAINLAKVPVYLWYHLFSRESLIFDALMIPFVVGGGFAGLWLNRRIPQQVFEGLILVLTAVSVVMLFR